MTSESNQKAPLQPHPTVKLPARQQPKTGGRLIEWKDGVPVPVYSQPLNKQQTSDLLTAALALEYTGDTDPETGEPYHFEVEFAGMTYMEVMAVRLARKAAGGHDKSITEVLDRILGKPKQSVESVGVKMTYRDFLESLAGEDPSHQKKTEITIDITPGNSIFDDDEDDDDEEDCLAGL